MPRPVNPIAHRPVDEVRGRLAFWLRVDPAHLLWPARCLACGDRGQDGRDLCAACAASLPWNVSACVRCALPLPATPPLPAGAALVDGAGRRCGDCLHRGASDLRRGRTPSLHAVHAACIYAAPLDRLLPRFKFHHDLAAGTLLAQLMAQAFAGLPPPEALVPVPLHRSRLRHRGYDQALELARPLARSLDLPLRDDLLQRVRATAAQSQLDARQRQRNLRNAFVVPDGRPRPAHVALIDDVMTTGATLHAAAVALHRAGVQRVDAWVCARVA